MTEHTVDVGRGISLTYEQFGEGEPLVLIAGLSEQLNSWPTEFCQELADRGYQVTRFDNRDVGTSTHIRFRPASPLAMLTRRWPPEQYTLTDMAEDTVGLLDALGHDDAHLVGISMGGMIAQTVAAKWPKRARTLTSIMSTTGARKIGRPALSTWLRMATKPPTTREGAMDRSAAMFRHIGSHGFPYDEAWVRQHAGEAWDKDPTTGGAARQLAAILKSGDRTSRLRAVTTPTLVVHGDRDLMVHPTGGLATQRAIIGARLATVPGMGHDLPRGAWPVLLDLIDDHAKARSSDAPTTS